MTTDLLQGRQLVAYDTETHLIQPGLLTPPLVCASYADGEAVELVDADTARAVFVALISNPRVLLGGANIVYDFGVHSGDEQRQVEAGAPVPSESIVDRIFAALEESRVVDTHILEPLHDNALGRIFTDPNTGQEFGRYSLGLLEYRYFGLDRSAEKKGDNAWRLKYATLEHLPIEGWPQDAVDYPKRDAVGTRDVLLVQLGLAGTARHDWQTVPDPNAKPTDFMQDKDVCRLCGAEDSVEPCPLGKPPLRHNLHCAAFELRAAWMLQLASIWGMRTDPVMVPEVVGEIRRTHEESRRKFFDAGIVRVRPCNKKEGEYERADDIAPEWLAEAEAHLRAMAASTPINPFSGGPPDWISRRLADIETCRKALAKGRPIRFAEDKKVLKELVEAAYNGDPPLTAGGESGNQQTSTSRDTLNESDDPLLEEYGEAGGNEKLFSTYVSVLEQGVRVPICPEANPLVATQRTSYRKPNLQQLPRKGDIRHCFVPRGYEYVEVQG